MQAKDGHFFYRIYPVTKAKTPMLHWAQATMYKALAFFLEKLVGGVALPQAQETAVPAAETV